PAMWRDPKALAGVAKQVPTERLNPQLLTALCDRRFEGDEELLRAGQRRHPGDFWINFTLANVLSRRSPAEAVGFYRAALALRPSTFVIHNNLGMALYQMGQVDEAIIELRKALTLDAKSARVHNNVGAALAKKKQWDDAIAEFRQAIALEDEYAP